MGRLVDGFALYWGEFAESGVGVERVDVCGANDPEVAFVERGDHGLVEAFSGGDGGRVDDVETGIGVGGDEFVNTCPISNGEIDDGDID